MRTSTKYYLLLLLITTAFASCDPIYYKPNRVNAPLLSEAGQVEFCASPNNTQAAFSPIKNLGIVGGFSRYKHRDEANFGVERVNFFELGAGYYRHLDSVHRGKRSGWIFDIYGGYGLGNINVQNTTATPYPSMDMSRAFIQPGIGIRTRVIEFALNWRFCNVHYSNFTSPANSKTPLEGRDYLFSEPALTFRVGYKPVKLEMQYVNSSPLSNVTWSRSGSTFNIGINVIINGYK